MRTAVRRAISRVLRRLLYFLDKMATLIWYERRLSEAATKQERNVQNRV